MLKCVLTLCVSPQVGRTRIHWSCASRLRSTQTEQRQHHRSPITSPSCYFIVLYGSFVRVGVQTCRVNLMLIEPQHKLRVKLTELIVFNGRGELKRFCTSILVLLPSFLFFFFYCLLWSTVSSVLSTSLLEMSPCKEDCFSFFSFFFSDCKIKSDNGSLLWFCFRKGTIVTHVLKCFTTVQPFIFFFLLLLQKLPGCYCLVYICSLDNTM